MLYLLSKILKKARLSSVKNSHIDKTSKIESGTSFINSSMDRYSFSGYDCSIINTEIGAFCSIASNVRIGGAAHPLHFVSTSPVFLSHKDSVKTKFAKHDYLPILKTKIGHDVWIGDGALVKAGINVGTGSVIGMGAVVTKDVPPYAIVAGNPAHLIRYRFPDDQIERLLKTEWWNLPHTQLNKIGKYMDDPETFTKHVLKK